MASLREIIKSIGKNIATICWGTDDMVDTNSKELQYILNDKTLSAAIASVGNDGKFMIERQSKSFDIDSLKRTKNTSSSGGHSSSKSIPSRDIDTKKRSGMDKEIGE